MIKIGEKYSEVFLGLRKSWSIIKTALKAEAIRQRVNKTAEKVEDVIFDTRLASLSRSRGSAKKR